MQQNRHAEAEDAYRRCLAVDPRHVEALVNLGFVLGELARPEEAKTCYQQALAIRPEQAETHHNLANILRDEGKVDEALAGYHEALRLKRLPAPATVPHGASYPPFEAPWFGCSWPRCVAP